MRQTSKHKRTPQSVAAIMHGMGIRRGSGDWNDYEAAKRAVSGKIAPVDYERTMRQIAGFLGL